MLPYQERLDGTPGDHLPDLSFNEVAYRREIEGYIMVTICEKPHYDIGLEGPGGRSLDELRRIQDKRRNRPSSPILGCDRAGHGRYRMTNSWHGKI